MVLERTEALQKSSLIALAKDRSTECYRFLWLRTFHQPVAIRLDINPDGSGMLTTQVASGGAGFNPGILREDRKIAMDQQQVRMFQTRVDQLGFWQMGRDTEPGGNDGAQRIIEGVKDGKYHFVDRWNPKTGAIRVSGLTLVMDLAQMNFPAEEVH